MSSVKKEVLQGKVHYVWICGGKQNFWDGIVSSVFVINCKYVIGAGKIVMEIIYQSISHNIAHK